MAPKKKSAAEMVSASKLAKLIEEETVDAYGDSEQVAGFFTKLEENLAMPFTTEVLGVEVVVERVDLSDDGRIVAVCARDKRRQRIPILDLPLPDPLPEGAEWVAAYRRWVRGG